MGLSLGADASPREPVARRLADDAAAVVSPDWLPLGVGWPSLDELAAEHRRLLARRTEVADERRRLLQGFEAEDEGHRAAMSAAFREDTTAELPDVTPHAERQSALAAANRQLAAANDALDEFVTEAVERVEEEASSWLGDLADRREEAAQQRREAERLLAEARAEEVRAARLEEWLKRNAGLHPRRSFQTIPAMRHVTWAQVESYQPPEEPEPDGMGGLRPQLADTFPGPAQFAENLNRGATPPHRPSAEELRRSEELRTGGTPVPLVADIRTIEEE